MHSILGKYSSMFVVIAKIRYRRILKNHAVGMWRIDGVSGEPQCSTLGGENPVPRG
jgi:hypothetical protein